jgi:hypothetical protein
MKIKEEEEGSFGGDDELICTFCRYQIDMNDLVSDTNNRLYHECCYDREYPDGNSK